MPTSFRNFFKKCAVIIDCTEVFVERPKDLLARVQVGSNYKHHSTIKFMIGITAQGTISYVSKCASGRMSDKQIVTLPLLIFFYLVMLCNYIVYTGMNFFCVCVLGDVVLADQVFTCPDHIGMYMAEIKMPPFTKGKKQLE